MSGGAGPALRCDRRERHFRVVCSTAARIVHVADAYDAITSARAYRRARPSGEALRELWRCAGTEFHAEIVGALANALPGVTSESSDVEVETVHA